MWTKDLRRAVDYLSTRADVDTDRLAYVGLSWGARLAAINLALEPRFKVSVLYLAGFMTAPRRPEVDEINFLPHVTIPTLVMSGKYDDIFPLQTAAVPFFQLLGTPPDRKQQKLYPTQHFLPRDEQIRETLNWLDRYLGPVKTPVR
jgi:dienelactone hydrolase